MKANLGPMGMLQYERPKNNDPEINPAVSEGPNPTLKLFAYLDRIDESIDS